MSTLHRSEFQSLTANSSTHPSSVNLSDVRGPLPATAEISGQNAGPLLPAPRPHPGWFDAVALQEHRPRTGSFSLGEICVNKLRNMEMDSEIAVKLQRAQRAIFVLALGLVLTAIAVDAQPLVKHCPPNSPQISGMPLAR
jgi:hypothetical protein